MLKKLTLSIVKQKCYAAFLVVSFSVIRANTYTCNMFHFFLIVQIEHFHLINADWIARI